MKMVRYAMMIGLVMGIGVGMLQGNNGSDGEGICISISPQTLVLSSPVGCVSVHTNLPIGLVENETVALEGVAPYLVTADALGDLVAKFDAEVVKSLVSPGEVTLTLSGVLADGMVFSASDTIMVKE